MIYSQAKYIALLLLLAICKESLSFRSIPQHKVSITTLTRRNAVPEWMQGGDLEESTSTQALTVRFINTPTGEDVVVNNVLTGANLLALGDEHGIKLPRACRTGLCGSCTCEVKDPAAIQTDTNPRAGFATIRACSTKCGLPAGMSEMVIDVGRMRKTKKSSGGRSVDDSDLMDPMARFGDNWEVDFKKNTRISAKQCSKCDHGRVDCMQCNGKGSVIMGYDRQFHATCPVCIGRGSVACGYCQGKGTASKTLIKRHV